MNSTKNKIRQKKGILKIGALISIIILVSSLIVAGQQNPTPTHKTFDIAAKQFFFSPSKLYVNKGDTVTLRFTSVDVEHGVYIDGYEINEKIHALGEGSTEVTFVADKTGKFKFRCSMVCGYMHPFMIGEIVVEPNNRFYVSIALAMLIPAGILLSSALGRKKEGDLDG